MILVLEDDNYRAALLYQRMTPKDRDNTMWCKTVPEAIQILWDYKDALTKVIMEHDLNGEDYVHSARTDCGMEVIRYLERLFKKNELGNLKNICYRIHSWNTVAGNKMYKRLKAIKLKVEYVPFGL